MPTCSYSPCEKPVRATGLCAGHYTQKSLGKELRPLRRRNPGATCDFEGCDQPHKAKGLCVGHWWQSRNGDTLKPLWHRLREVGDARETSQGYIQVKVAEETPGTYPGGWIMQHRQVMQTLLGRALLESEEVHHKNGVRSDNRPENLELWVVKQPKGQRPEDLVEWAKEILATYG